MLLNDTMMIIFRPLSFLFSSFAPKESMIKGPPEPRVIPSGSLHYCASDTASSADCPVAYLAKEVNSCLAKPALKYNAGFC